MGIPPKRGALLPPGMPEVASPKLGCGPSGDLGGLRNQLLLCFHQRLFPALENGVRVNGEEVKTGGSPSEGKKEGLWNQSEQEEQLSKQEEEKRFYLPGRCPHPSPHSLRDTHPQVL